MYTNDTVARSGLPAAFRGEGHLSSEASLPVVLRSGLAVSSKLRKFAYGSLLKIAECLYRSFTLTARLEV